MKHFASKHEIPRKKMIATVFTAVLAISCFSFLVNQVKADTYNQIPLWINVMEGATVDEVPIEKTMDQIFKANGLNWRVTSVVLKENYTDPDKSKDQPGDVRVAEDGYTEEEKPIWGAGKDETKNLGGFKVFVVRRILDENGTDSGTNGVAQVNGSTAIVAQPSYGVPPIGGDTWTHEIAHLFGLTHQNGDGSDRPTDNLLYPTRDGRNGTKLTPEDIGKMNASKMERELGLPSLTNDQILRTYDMYRYIADDPIGDSFYKFTDIVEVYFGFYILDNTRNLHITTYVNGLIPPGIALSYQIALDIDNNPFTGGDFMGMPGMDFLIDVNVFAPGMVEAFLYKYPEHMPIAPLEARIDTHCKFICTEDTVIPPLPCTNSIVVTTPLQMLGPLAPMIGVGAFMQSADGLGTDTLDKRPLLTVPPERPTVTFDPPTGPAGTSITARGQGFTPGHSVSIVFAHDELSDAIVGPGGSFETHFTVPSQPEGHYMVDAIEHSNQIAVNMFTITSSAAVGGFALFVDKLNLLAPYIGIALMFLIGTALTVVYVRRSKHAKEKQ